MVDGWAIWSRVKLNYDRLRTDKALGNFRKSDNNNNEQRSLSLGMGTLFGSKNASNHLVKTHLYRRT